MNIVATSSAGLVVIAERGRTYDFFGVPSSVLGRVRGLIQKGRQPFNLLKPYSAKLERVSMVERLNDKQEGANEMSKTRQTHKGRIIKQ